LKVSFDVRKAIEELEAMGISFTLRKGNIRWKASNQLSEEAKKKLAELKQHKKEVKKLLKERKANELLKKQGWFLLNSSVLGEVVAVAKDKNTKVPKNYVTYTLDEIKVLKKEFDEGQLDEEGLKRIH